MNAQVNNVGDFFGNVVSRIVDFIPEMLGAAFILLIGYFVAKALCKLVDGLLDKVNLDERLHSGQGGNMIQKMIPHPSDLLGKIAFWLVFLFAISAAVSTLGVPLLTAMIQGIYAYIPNVLAALVIFLVAGSLAGASAGLVQRTMGDTPTGKVVKTALPTVIMSIAGFMILNQLKIAPAIVTITYAAIMFSSGLGLALAFGLGGRGAAARLVNSAYTKGQQSKTQVKTDLAKGKEKAKEDAEKVKSQKTTPRPVNVREVQQTVPVKVRRIERDY